MTGSPTDYAWAAGFVDGEGYICVTKKAPWEGIRRSGRGAGKVRRERGSYYWMVLVVVNRNPAPLQKLVELFGGNIVYKARQQGKNGYHMWRLNSQQALAAAEAMLPFLVGKADLARHCISFQRWYNDTRVAGREMAAERRNHAEFYYLECRRLLRLFNSYSAVGRKHNSPAPAEVVTLATGTEPQQ